MPRVCWGVGGEGRLDEIDTCICHRHVKSDIARPTSVDQVNHASLKMSRTFSITKAKQLWIKTILSTSAHQQVGLFQEKRGSGEGRRYETIL